MTVQKELPGRGQGGLFGSLREALAAAGREETAQRPVPVLEALLPTIEPVAATAAGDTAKSTAAPPLPPAADAVREARAGVPNIPPLARAEVLVDGDTDDAPTTRVHRARPVERTPKDADEGRTRIVRGKAKVTRDRFEQDPVVGWLVVIGGPGMGSFRPIFEGNNTLGRSPRQRIPIDFGDDAISSEEQAYIRYDSSERSFLFVPNLAKTNIVSLNGKRPTAAVALAAMDVIAIGRTQLVFVPFCGPDFDWAEIAEKAD